MSTEQNLKTKTQDQGAAWSPHRDHGAWGLFSEAAQLIAWGLAMEHRLPLQEGRALREPDLNSAMLDYCQDLNVFEILSSLIHLGRIYPPPSCASSRLALVSLLLNLYELLVKATPQMFFIWRDRQHTLPPVALLLLA